MATKKTKTTIHHKHNPWRSTHVPLFSWITFWALVLATMALVVVNLSQAFAPPYPSNDMDTQTIAELQAVRANLESQLANLQQAPKSASNGRMLVQNASTTECGPAWSDTTTTQTVVYVEPLTKVQATLPYSFDWGNDQYALTPGDAGDPSNPPEIDFGPAVVHTERYGCFITRDSSLSIKEPGDSPNNVRRGFGQIGVTVKERTVGGVTVLSYTNNQNASWPKNWEVFGRTHTYLLSSHGWLTDDEAIKIIQSLKVVK
jgi:hypothetical protein